MPTRPQAPSPPDPSPPDPFFHEASGTVRFWVPIRGLLVGASISRETLHYRFHPQRLDDEALPTYLAHAADLAAAVRRRVAGGSIEPVMLREHDLRAPD